LREFTICYTFENDIITEKILKKIDVNTEDVKQEIIEKMERYKYFIVENDQGRYLINPNLVRFVRVTEEKNIVR
jgi:transcriptional regulator of NAD metabolism